MSLDHLSARDLAQIDAICLEYEAELRNGKATPVDALIEKVAPELVDVLRDELDAIREEVERALKPKPIVAPFQSITAPSATPSATPPATASATTPTATGQPVSQISKADEPELPGSDAERLESEKAQPTGPEIRHAEPATSNPPEHPTQDPVATALTQVIDPPLGARIADDAAGRHPDDVVLPDNGDRIGPYIVLGELGRGGMGAVFRASDPRLDREVAIKMLLVGGHKRQELNDRFEREAKAVAALTHPNIVELFDVGVENGQPYAVMELLRGETLAQRMQQGRLTGYEVRYIGAQIADALAVAHEHGVIHRDLKPQNVMIVGKRPSQMTEPSKVSRFELATNRQLTDNDAYSAFAKIFDFGLSRVSRTDLSDRSTDTKVGAIMGTPGYMSPEQVRGEPASTAADIFSLGCILFKAFYGHEAIPGPTTADRLASTLTATAEADPERRKEDVVLADLIDACLSKDADARPSSAAEIAAILREPVQAIDPVMSNLDEGILAGEFVRRRFFAMVGGAAFGAIGGAALVVNPTDELTRVRSLAVLSLDDRGGSALSDILPIGDRSLSVGDKLSALLVNELSRMDDVSVPPFHIITASSPEEFIRLGRELDVDAFVTGSVTPNQIGEKEYLDIDLRIVSASTGKQLWAHKDVAQVGDNLLQQSQLATDIASRIGRRLTSTLHRSEPPKVESYSCLVDGKVRSDPDSIQGMTMALMCLEKARSIDPRYAEPIAGIALTSIMLAAQSDEEKTVARVQQALEATESALKLDGLSVSANLAQAMLEWQIFQRYVEAEALLEELTRMHPYHWQVHHQHGLLLLATGQTHKAATTLRTASQLNPMSMMIKVDGARAAWFDSNADRAISDAMRYASQRANHQLALGLMIDIHEQRKQYESAAALDREFVRPKRFNQESYYEQRAKRLKQLPYGPFGELMNRAILESRTGRTAEDAWLAELAESQSPMFPLILAAHPAMERMRVLERARTELLPQS